MKLLALDTATEACSAALWLNGEIVERFQLAPREHNRLILPMIDGLLTDAGLRLADLDALAFGRGPGSFTGVRIATGVIQGIAFASDLPVVPVSTLAAMALEAMAETGCELAMPSIDARMGEVYWAVYRRVTEDAVEPVVAEAVVSPDEVESPAACNGIGIGSGWGAYEERLRQRLPAYAVSAVLAPRFPRAGHIARLAVPMAKTGVAVAAENAQPVYLRDNVAKKPGSSQNIPKYPL
jgi:tRNA threonylcarbamoyladenosine biosynthesis protein TsaB